MVYKSLRTGAGMRGEGDGEGRDRGEGALLITPKRG